MSLKMLNPKKSFTKLDGITRSDCCFKLTLNTKLSPLFLDNIMQGSNPFTQNPDKEEFLSYQKKRKEGNFQEGFFGLSFLKETHPFIIPDYWNFKNSRTPKLHQRDLNLCVKIFKVVKS